MKFTQAQQQAIQHRDHHALISAGAGSGKTAVLSERVLALLKDGLSLDQLIVLTFTNAAAKEMKERIRQKIIQATQEGHIDASQLRLIDSAHIQTFDSFALYLFKTYGHVDHRSKDISLMDPILYKQLKTDLIEDLFEARYRAQDTAFLTLIDTYALKTDERIKTWVLKYYEALDQHIDAHALAIKHTEDAFEPAQINETLNQFERMILTIKEEIIEEFYHTREHEGDDAVLRYYDLVDEQFIHRFKTMGYDALHALALRGISGYPTFSAQIKETMDEEAIKRVTDFNQRFKKRIKDELLSLTKIPLSHWRWRHETKAPMVRVLIDLVKTLDQTLRDVMHQEGRYTFTAIAREALTLVKKTPDIQAHLKRQFKEILVDEYQDTSIIQEALIDALNLPRRFMVGDMKQSIYRFRHADVTIFKDKQDRYLKGDGGRLIALNDNFRSRKEVIDDLNQLFETLFSPRFGGLTYDHWHQLDAKNERFKHQHPQPYGLVVHHVHAAELNDHPFDARRYEVAAMADHILTRVNEEKTLEGETLRPLRFQDITILIDRRNHFELFAEIFEAKGIPLILYRDEPLVNSELLQVLSHAVKAILSLQPPASLETDFKRALYGLARSFLWRLDDEIILEALLALDNTSFDGWVKALPEPLKTHVHTLQVLADEVQTYPLDEAMFKIVETLDVLSQLTALKDTQAQRARLDNLLLTLPALAQAQMTLEGFVDYLTAASEAEIDMPYRPLKDHQEDAVTLMTIHGSKGLQFPHLYVAHLDNPFKKPKTDELFFDRDLGFILPVLDDQRLATDVTLWLKKMREIEALISERLRQWYVALTRAEESIHLWLWSRDKTPVTMSDVSSFGDFLRLLPYNLKGPHETLNPMIVPQPHQSSSPKDLPLSDLPPKTYLPAVDALPAKTQTRFSIDEINLLSPETLQAMRYGDALHQWLERIDFTQDPLKQLADLEVDSTTHQHLKTFFTQPLLTSIEIQAVYQEYAFVDDSDDTLRQGFIDCLIETKDRMIVIDYKLKTIDKEAYIAQVKGYMNVVKTQFQKPVEGYLYSLIEGRFQKVEERV